MHVLACAVATGVLGVRRHVCREGTEEGPSPQGPLHKHPHGHCPSQQGGGCTAGLGLQGSAVPTRSLHGTPRVKGACREQCPPEKEQTLERGLRRKKKLE